MSPVVHLVHQTNCLLYKVLSLLVIDDLTIEFRVFEQ